MELRQSAKQVQTLTPQMQQSLAILQCSLPQLTQYVAGIALENPFVELNEGAHPPAPVQLARPPQPAYEADDTPALQEPAAPATPTLQDELLALAAVLALNKQQAQQMRTAIFCLDANGYINHSQLLQASCFAGDTTALAATLAALREIGPPGIGAQNLCDCLLVQLQQQGLLTPVMQTLVTCHLEDLAQGKLHKVAQAVHGTTAEVAAALAQIKGLNPRPANGFAAHSGQSTAYVYPDLQITQQSGVLQVTLTAGLPLFFINEDYLRMVATAQGETAVYLKHKLQQAQWLQGCLTRRSSTLLQCANAAVQVQQPFFMQGPQALQPLTLAKLAQITGLHPSTVGRAMQGKYFTCRWGVYPLRALLGGAHNNGTQAQALQHLAALIKAENAARPYSDQQLAALLAKAGLAVSRRTVAKYRGMLGIPGTAARKSRS